MSRITDEKLDKMLTAYCEAEPEQTFVWKAKPSASPIPLHKKTGIVAFAASLVLVSAVVLAITLSSSGKKSPVAVYTPPVSSETGEATYALTSATEPSSDAPEDTEQPTGITEAQPPTLADEKADAENIAEETKAPQVVEEPSQLGSEAATAAPQTEPSEEASAPEESEPTEVPGPVTCYGSISNDRMSEDGKVYFQIVATGQSIFEDPGVFDDSHLAQTDTTDDGFTIVSFTINRLDVYSPRKKHFYCFYNSSGDILYRDGFD